MRQLPLTALMLLISAQAASADYHVRHATYACVDPQATVALNDPVSRHPARSTIRRRGRCFWVRPHEHWQQISRPTHSLRLLRRKPPHPGEPPLYFRSASIEIARLHKPKHGGSRRHLALPTHPYVEKRLDIVTTFMAPSAELRIPAPISWAPAASVAIIPVPDATSRAVTSPVPRPVPRDVMQRFAPLLVWALIIAFVLLMVRMVLRRRQSLFAVISPRSASSPTEADIRRSACRNRCVARLRGAGWAASSRSRGDDRGADVIASNGDRMLALQCHSSMQPVDTKDIEDACLAREIQGSDLAVIVSNASFTESARELAALTGIVLLHEDQLASFAA